MNYTIVMIGGQQGEVVPGRIKLLTPTGDLRNVDYETGDQLKHRVGETISAQDLVPNTFTLKQAS